MKNFRHFIKMNVSVKGYVGYYYNTYRNIMGDFSYYQYNSKYNDWVKYRRYRGKYVYSKKPHYENRYGEKEWYCFNGNAYGDYETYLMTVIE